MNVHHDHSSATASADADKLENDIQAILDYLILLIDELKKRIRKHLSTIVLFSKYLFPLLIGLFIISRLRHVPKKKRSQPEIASNTPNKLIFFGLLRKKRLP